MSLAEDLQDENSAIIANAKTRTCDVCQAKKGELCRNVIQEGIKIPGRLVHLARLIDRNPKKGDQ